MTHISRPFQIALAAAVLLAGVWFFALRNHAPSTESSGSSSSSSAPAASSAPSSASSHSAPGGAAKASQAKPSSGSAPGVAGLTRAIAKAQGAVKESEQNAKQLQQNQAQTQQQSSSATRAGQRSATHATTKHATATPPARQTHAPGVAATPAKQTLVEAQLKHGRTVIVLFWNPKGSVDVAVRRQLASLKGAHDRNVAVHYSSAAEVGQYGAITRSLQVLQTPTMLVIAPNGSTKTLTGLVDAYAIDQAIGEAHGSH